MNSALYAGTVRHRRFSPVAHEFAYSIFLVYLDLAELETVFRGRWFWSTSRPALARFTRADHLGDPAIPLETAVRDVVEGSGRRRPEGPIRLLTHLRYFGYVMNPVSFYYCFDRAGTRVETIVAEVENTPWGERHCYVLPAPDRGLAPVEFAKAFHVSPFMPMNMTYRWRLSEPNTHATVHMENITAAGKVFDATLTLTRVQMTGTQLTRMLVVYPFMTARVITAIYWQALKLWWKGASYHAHPRHAPATTDAVGAQQPGSTT